MENTSKTSLGNVLKIGLSIALIAIQFLLIFGIILRLSEYMDYAYKAFQFFSLLFALYIVNTEGKVSYKFSWIIFILAMPICGMVFYFIWGKAQLPKKTRVRAASAFENTKGFLKQDKAVIDEITDEYVKRHISLMQRMSDFPVYKNTKTKYLEIGETYFECMLEELKKAEKFILIEYFIIAEGTMKQQMMEILFEKAAKGVEVKIMYDEVGSTGVVPKNFVFDCEKHGIMCAPHNSLTFSIFSYISYRDHRKILVIDGNTAMTGGINIGDEYINAIEKHGHWKDTGIMLKGDAVFRFTMLFVWMWEIVTGEKLDPEKYKGSINYPEEKGIIMPFGDGPVFEKSIAANNYMHIITSAKNYVYITTPYLIIDSDMIAALCLSAESGVDVRIITPHIPDKAIVHATTQSFYGELMRSGVKIYEYTPGFIHAKSIVSDDTTCTIGSINFDYRSLYWNYECGVYIYGDSSVIKLKNDILETLKKSQRISLDEWEKQPLIKRMARAFLRVVSPLI